MRKRPARRRSSATEFRARIAIEPTAIGPANRMVLGQTTDWVHPSSAPALWTAHGLAPDVVETVRRLGPSSLRFPGRHADGYSWTWGTGDPGSRPNVQDVRTGRSLPHRFGTDEVLDLCKAVGARPWFQTNVSDPPDEMLGWSRHAQSRGTPVWHWELGGFSGSARSPEDAEAYLGLAAAQLRWLRAETPEAIVGVPGHPAPEDHWNERVLAELGDGSDFLAVPLEIRVDPPERDGDETPPDAVRTALLRAIAAPIALRERVRAHLDVVRLAVPLREVGLAVTSWAVRIGGVGSGWNGTMAAGLATAGCVHALLREPLVVAAHYASFLEPAPEACVIQERSGVRSSVHHAVLSLYGRMGTELLGVQITSDVFRLPPDDQLRMPVLDAVATRGSDGAVAAFLLNRDLDHPRYVELDAEGLDLKSPRAAGVWSEHHLDTNGPAAGEPVRALPHAEAVTVREGLTVHGEGPWRIEVPAAAVVVVEWEPAPEGSRRWRRKRR